MEDLNKIRKLAGLQEAPQDLDNDQLIFQRLQKLENLFAKFNPNDLKKVMQDMMEGYTKLEKALINNDKLEMLDYFEAEVGPNQTILND